MADREYKHYRGEGGKVWRLELPLSKELAQQVEKGLLVEVEPEKPKRAPAKKATAKPEPEKPEPTPEVEPEPEKPAE